MQQTAHTYCLIIGSGIAGLTLAIKLAETYPQKTITIVTKSKVEESNTKYAQGGVAVVLNKVLDSYDKHINDTLIAGDGLCNKPIVEQVVKKGPDCFKTLLKWGSQFDKDISGDFDLGKEGGHSENRVVHHKDITGFEIERTLLQKLNTLDNIELLEHHFAIDLIVEHGKQSSTCYGVHVLNTTTQTPCRILAETTILATGGVGQIYGHTTNPLVATGDGLAMAKRAKANISNMEFIQFHPTVLYSEKQEKAFLISEAVRGFGAHLKTQSGERFMFQFDKRGELASRDIVSKAIHQILKTTKTQWVYLDCTHLDMEVFKLHFPNIYQHCLNKGINLSTDWIPVIPASHYLCGGIDVNRHGETSILNLFACGECSNTGLHGANRLASNSLLEALVYAHQIFNRHVLLSPKLEQPKLKDLYLPTHPIPPNYKLINRLINQVQLLMRQNAGIVRSTSGLYSTNDKLHHISIGVEQLFQFSILDSKLLELRNIIDTAILIVSQSIKRQENKGGFYNEDLTE